MSPAIAVVLVSLLALGLPAQTPVVSPAMASANAGNAAVHLRTPVHLQQVHRDLAGQSLLIHSLALRSDGSAFPRATQATVDVELTLAAGDYDAVTADFPGNLRSTPSIVFARRPTNLPDWTSPTSTPAPFDFVVPFDSPFLHIAGVDLLWEMTIDNASFPNDHFADEFVDPITVPPGQILGQGCSTGVGAPWPYASYAISPHPRVHCTWLVDWVPPGAGAVVMLVGTSDPLLNLPWLCATVHTSGEVACFLAPTTGGPWRWQSVVPWTDYPPLAIGTSLFHQAVIFAVDAAGAPTTELTAGLRVDLPSPPPCAPLGTWLVLREFADTAPSVRAGGLAVELR